MKIYVQAIVLKNNEFNTFTQNWNIIDNIAKTLSCIEYWHTDGNGSCDCNKGSNQCGDGIDLISLIAFVPNFYEEWIIDKDMDLFFYCKNGIVDLQTEI